MKINWKKYEDQEHVLTWFILGAMRKIGVEKFGEFDPSALNVEVNINGVEVSVVDHMEFLQQQLNFIEECGRERGFAEAKQMAIDRVEDMLTPQA